MIVLQFITFLSSRLHSLFVGLSQILGFIRSVQFGVIGEMSFEDKLLPPGQMSWVDGDTVVLFRSTFSDISPVSILLLQIQTGSVGNEDDSSDPSGETKPTDDPELGVVVDIVIENGWGQGTEFTGSGGKTVSSSSDGNREHLRGEKESGTAVVRIWSNRVWRDAHFGPNCWKKEER